MEMMNKKISINNLKTRHFPWLVSAFLVLFLTAGLLLYWFAGESTGKRMAERVKLEKLTLARSGAFSIESFFKEREKDLVLLSEIEAVKSLKEKEARERIGILIEELKGEPVAGVGRVDKEGVLRWVVNKEDKREGEDVSVADRDYFVWAKKQTEPGKIFVSKPIKSRAGVSGGGYILVLATPVFYQREFNGLILFSLSLVELTERFVAPLTFSGAVHSLIAAEDGLVVAASIPNSIGENIADCLDEEEIIAAYAPIKIGDQVWSLRVLVPYREAVKLTMPFKINQTRGLVFALVGVLILVLTFILGVRVAQRDGFVDGFKNGRDGVKSS